MCLNIFLNIFYLRRETVIVLSDKRNSNSVYLGKIGAICLQAPKLAAIRLNMLREDIETFKDDRYYSRGSANSRRYFFDRTCFVYIVIVCVCV